MFVALTDAIPEEAMRLRCVLTCQTDSPVPSESSSKLVMKPPFGTVIPRHYRSTSEARKRMWTHRTSVSGQETHSQSRRLLCNVTVSISERQKVLFKFLL